MIRESNYPITLPFDSDNGINIYGLTESQMQLFFKYLNATFLTDLDKLFNDRGQYVLKFLYYPFDIRNTNGATTNDEYVSNVNSFNTNYPEEGIVLGNIIATESGSVRSGHKITLKPYLSLIDPDPDITNFAKNGFFIPFGSITIDKYFNNFMDYSPYTVIKMYLPFVGEFDLDTNIVMGKTLYIDYYYDISSGDGFVRISANFESNDGNIRRTIITKPCKLGFEIPLVYDSINSELKLIGNAMANIALAGIGSGLSSYATQQANASLGSIHTTTTTLKSTSSATAFYKKKPRSIELYGDGRATMTEKETPLRPSVDTSKESFVKSVGDNVIGLFNTNVGDVKDYNTVKDLTSIFNSPYGRITIKRPQTSIPSNYNHTMGVPCAEYVTLGSLTGFTKVGAIHLENFTTATENEVSEIYSLLNDGVIF